MAIFNSKLLVYQMVSQHLLLCILFFGVMIAIVTLFNGAEISSFMATVIADFAGKLVVFLR